MSTRRLNRELSWLEFDDRVLWMATDSDLPLLERVKFAAIFASNMDEFFQVRVAGLERRLRRGQDPAADLDGMGTDELLRRIRSRVLESDRRVQRLIAEELVPGLDAAGIAIRRFEEIDTHLRREAREIFWHQVLPQLSPMPLEAEWSFPGVPSLALGVAVQLRERGEDRHRFAYLRAPRQPAARFVAVGKEGRTLVPVESLIEAHLEEVFPWAAVEASVAFQACRDADTEYDADDADLVRTVEAQLRRRRQGRVVRLITHGTPPDGILDRLNDVFATSERHLYAASTLIGVSGLWEVVQLPGFGDLRDPEPQPVAHPRMRQRVRPIFEEIAGADLLVRHPYHSHSDTVERFVREAVDDPDVLAIKHTIYRTSDDTSVVPALIATRNRERRSVCLVEIKARFDERANLQWGRELEEAGVQVSYGLPGYKTHMKAVLVVRREPGGVRRYAHIGTGNYNADTARQYTDLGLFTDDPEICADLADIFHWLTDGAPRPNCRKLLLAPFDLRDGILAEIQRCSEAARQGEPARIMMKMNALVDPICIEALEAASEAGVRIELNVRGICCLAPGRTGQCSNIRVVSTVGRYLEHGRAYVFEAGQSRRVFMGSADLMPRNLDHRVEVLAPVEDPQLQEDIVDLLSRLLADRSRAWELQGDGSWIKLDAQPGEDVHLDLFRLAAAGA